MQARSSSDTLHLDLDGAWTGADAVRNRLDATEWGPRLRFSAPPRLVEKFYQEIRSDLRRFVVYGSGDFHYLPALFIRRITEAFVLISFDNHPDWAVTPPKWACGGWVNRALEIPNVNKISVWGCGNFECWWPHQIFGNRRAEREGRLEVHPWADGRAAADRNRRGAILRENWRDGFCQFIKTIPRATVYVTIDMDCLVETEAVTNWENGRFTVEDLVWALNEVREHCGVIGGDICGAYSEPKYERWKQRFAAEWDHPKLERPTAEEIREINLNTLRKLWPALIGH